MSVSISSYFLKFNLLFSVSIYELCSLLSFCVLENWLTFFSFPLNLSESLHTSIWSLILVLLILQPFLIIRFICFSVDDYGSMSEQSSCDESMSVESLPSTPMQEWKRRVRQRHESESSDCSSSMAEDDCHPLAVSNDIKVWHLSEKILPFFHSLSLCNEL